LFVLKGLGPANNFIFVGEQLKQEIWEKYQVINITMAHHVFPPALSKKQ